MVGSSSGPGCYPFTVDTRVRVPYRLQQNSVLLRATPLRRARYGDQTQVHIECDGRTG